MRLLIIVIATVVPAVSGAASSRPAPVMRCIPENTKVGLTGTVILRKFYGPPNYGEDPKTDLPMRVPLVRLDRAITPCEIGRFDSIERKRAQRVRLVRLEGAVGNLKSGEHRKFVGTIYPAAMAIDLLPYVLDLP